MEKRTDKMPSQSRRMLFVGGLVGLCLAMAGLVALARLGVDLGLENGPQARMVVEQFWNPSERTGKRVEAQPGSAKACTAKRRVGKMSVMDRAACGTGAAKHSAGKMSVMDRADGGARAAKRSAGEEPATRLGAGKTSGRNLSLGKAPAPWEGGSAGPGLVWVNARAWDDRQGRDRGKVLVAALAWQAKGMERWHLEIQGRCGRVTVSAGRLVGDRPAVLLFDVKVACRPSQFDLVSHGGRDGSGRAVVATLKARPPLADGLAPHSGIWPVTAQWSQWFEWLYSAWIRQLFAEPRQTWRPLHQVVRDPKRNLLYGLLGLNEDASGRIGGAVTMWADCADVAYQLRAYFAWKMGLAMRFRECSRGSVQWGPRCDRTWTNLVSDFDDTTDPVARFNRFIREGVAWKVHSGTLRTLPEDTDSDAYPLAVRPGSVLPGAMYVDVAGHILVVVDVGPLDLVAIDGHPDKTVTVRRFSRPRFFPFYKTLTGGLKAFRPLRFEGGLVRALSNRDLGPRFSLEQYSFDSGAAYRRFVRFRLFDGLFLHGAGARASAAGIGQGAAGIGQGDRGSLL